MSSPIITNYSTVTYCYVFGHTVKKYYIRTPYVPHRKLYSYDCSIIFVRQSFFDNVRREQAGRKSHLKIEREFLYRCMQHFRAIGMLRSINVVDGKHFATVDAVVVFVSVAILVSPRPAPAHHHLVVSGAKPLDSGKVVVPLALSGHWHEPLAGVGTADKLSITASDLKQMLKSCLIELTLMHM